MCVRAFVPVLGAGPNLISVQVFNLYSMVSTAVHAETSASYVRKCWFWIASTRSTIRSISDSRYDLTNTTTRVAWMSEWIANSRPLPCHQFFRSAQSSSTTVKYIIPTPCSGEWFGGWLLGCGFDFGSAAYKYYESPGVRWQRKFGVEATGTTNNRYYYYCCSNSCTSKHNKGHALTHTLIAKDKEGCFDFIIIHEAIRMYVYYDIAQCREGGGGERRLFI